MADQFPAPTKKVLSPAAQAIWDAFNATAERVGTFEDYGDALAAALRAAADQVVSPIPDDCTADVFNRQLKIRSELLTIATELEAQ
jgi:hypothetical protein